MKDKDCDPLMNELIKEKDKNIFRVYRLPINELKNVNKKERAVLMDKITDQLFEECYLSRWN